MRDFLQGLAPSFDDPDRYEDVVQAVLFQYTPWPELDNREANRYALGEMQTDYYFGAPADYQAKLHSADGNDVFYYVYSHQRNNSFIGNWRGSIHASEIQYLFGYPYIQENEAVRNHTGIRLRIRLDEFDFLFSDFIIKLWTNFAKTGNPTSEPVTTPHGDEVTWPLFEADEHEYLFIGSDVMEERSNYKQKNYAFMQHYFRWMAYGEEMP